MDEQIKGLADDVKSVAARLDAIPNIDEIQKSMAESKAAAEAAQKTAAELGVMSNDLNGIRKMLEHGLGASGAQDFDHELNSFVKAVYHAKRGMRMPDWLSKAAHDYVTDIDARGGYLVPRLLANEITKLTLVHGQVWPLVNKVTIPAGVQFTVPWESVLSTATWRHGGAGTAQGTAGTEVDPGVEWGADVLAPKWLHGIKWISNEAMTAPGISIPQNLAMQLVAQIIRGIERAIIAGYRGTPTAATGRNAPSHGLLYNGSVQSQSAAATVTLALIDKFIGECLDDHEGSADTQENYLLTTHAVGHQLKSTLTQQGLDWGNVARGTYERLRGYQFVMNPFVTRAQPTAVRNHIILSPLGKITVGWSGQIVIDFNDRAIGATTAVGWTANETGLLVGTHADYGLGNPAMHHKAVFTALA